MVCVRFTSQVWPGDTLTATATATATATVDSLGEEEGHAIVTLQVSTTNQDGREVLSGEARAHIDS